MSIESLLKDIRQRGCRVNNLFQRMDGQWQANLRGKDNRTFFEFAYGPDPVGALEGAIAKLEAQAKVVGVKTSDDDLDPTQIGISRHEGRTGAAPDAAPPSEDDLIG